MPEPGEMAALRGLADIAALPLLSRYGGSAGAGNPASDHLSEINILRIFLAHPTKAATPLREVAICKIYLGISIGYHFTGNQPVAEVCIQ